MTLIPFGKFHPYRSLEAGEVVIGGESKAERRREADTKFSIRN